MYGMDISNWQRGMDLSRGDYDFCILKATEGTTYTDPTFHNFAVQLTELNKLIGCYHFARPDRHGTVEGMNAEADYFLRVVQEQGLLGKAILVLDWEVEPMDREDLVTAWVSRVESQTGITPFIYSSKYKFSQWKDWWPVQHCPLWLAVWPSSRRVEIGKDPGFKRPVIDRVNWNIWQYTANGVYPGYNGNVDGDFANMSKKDWLMLAGMKEDEISNPNPAPKKEPEIISDDMMWAIENGLFIGYGDGRYGPKDALTREQAASLFRRYDEMRKG